LHARTYLQNGDPLQCWLRLGLGRNDRGRQWGSEIGSREPVMVTLLPIGWARLCLCGVRGKRDRRQPLQAAVRAATAHHGRLWQVRVRLFLSTYGPAAAPGYRRDCSCVAPLRTTPITLGPKGLTDPGNDTMISPPHAPFACNVNRHSQRVLSVAVCPPTAPITLASW
jgi:hypothetical protein